MQPVEAFIVYGLQSQKVGPALASPHSHAEFLEDFWEAGRDRLEKR